MNELSASHLATICRELDLRTEQVTATAQLFAEGATVPFIARYRKEATGSLDEVAVTAIRDRLEYLRELDDRRAAIRASLEERELFTDELWAQLQGAQTLAELEDIYLPYRPRRRTRATIAREKGLEPLAELLREQDAALDPMTAALEFIDPEKEVATAEEALAGAQDIIAEWVSEDTEARSAMRELFRNKGVIHSQVLSGKETEGAKFRDYFDWREPVSAAPSHRILAMLRGENELFLLVRVLPPEETALALLHGLFVKGTSPAAEEVRAAVEDGYKRLLSPSMENEIRGELKKRADEEAITVFAGNLRELLMQPALGERRVMALDPGFRTGCKLVCLDRQGTLLHHDTVFPTQSARQAKEAEEKVIALCRAHNIEVIAVGNGTGGRETELFLRGLDLPGDIPVLLVNESGASVYSASEVARTEFPDHDLTVRGAVSIGRRLMDPLAELVKIDPKSIGVGQYQHDVDQTLLKRSLDDVVVSCVNAVGVELNTASVQLLTYVSGLGPKLAENVVAYRTENGPFMSRKHLLKVPRLGPKAFEQAAGFLRIRGGDNPLDASAVHPESYSVVDAMAADLGCSVTDLMNSAELRSKVDLTSYVTETVGLPTLTDIMNELAKPGRDPRERFEVFQFAEGVEKMEDLKAGQKLPGVVTNVTKFGAFVDIGVHQDGLVHISELADHFVKEPTDVVKVNDKVSVTVLEVDLERKRIALSMKSNPGQKSESRGKPAGKPARRPAPQQKPQAPAHAPDTAMGQALREAFGNKSDNRD